jgi:hypothetical protein
MYCFKCGAENDDNAYRCVKCGTVIQGEAAARPQAAPPPDVGDSAGMRLLLPVGRSGWAIAAGYAGLFAITGIAAPVALILGIVAVWDIKAHPGKHGMGRAIFGIVAGGLITALIAIGIVAGALSSA